MQSRYYDAEVGRFVNADDAEFVANIKIKYSYNLYCYCHNSPVAESDFNGNLIASAVGKFLLYALFGAISQFVIDLIDFFVRLIKEQGNASFKVSPLGDYLSSAISWGMCSLNLFNDKLACFLAPFIPVVIKHLTNIFCGKFTWYSLLIDAASAFITGIISVALNSKMKNQIKKLHQKYGKRYADHARTRLKAQKIKIKINKTFLKISFTIVITTSIIQLFFNLLLQ